MAARLEALTKQLGKNVLLSHAFADLVKADFELERVGEFPVRGFNAPVEPFAYSYVRPSLITPMGFTGYRLARAILHDLRTTRSRQQILPPPRGK